MTLIEGVGDEVVQFAVAVLVLAVAALAWWSTNARPDRYRTVFVMRSRMYRAVTVNIRPRPNAITSSTQVNNTTQVATPDESASVTRSGTRSNTPLIPLQEMDSIVDADMAMMNNNRLHFYRRMDTPSTAHSAAESTSDESEVQEEAETPSNAQIREMDSIVSAMEADVTTGCDYFTRPNEPNATSASGSTRLVKKDESNSGAATSSDGNPLEGASGTAESSALVASEETSNIAQRRKILIKLKYLNDTLKEVEGSLDEMLRDFKSRHFSTELSSECRVRLIFNGRVLVDDAATLRACGLHDRAVVHCLVHPKRAVGQNAMSEDSSLGATHELVEGVPPERTWDLENILMTLVSVALTVVWFFRCEYSNMFTASASVALFGLTVFYSVAIFGLYLSDTFHFDRRPAQPVPNN